MSYDIPTLFVSITVIEDFEYHSLTYRSGVGEQNTGLSSLLAVNVTSKIWD